MQVKRSTPLISSQPAIIWIMWPCEPLATNPLPHPLYMMSHFLLTRWNSLPKSSLRHTRTFLMCSHKKRLRTCLPIANLTMKFTLRMTRCLPIATSTRSLAQSSVSFANSSTICSARDSSNHPNRQVVHLFSCKEEGWHPATLCGLLKPQQDHSEGSIPDPTCYQSPQPTGQCQGLHQAQPPCWLLQHSCHSRPRVEDSLPNTLWLLQVPGHANGTY